MHQPKHQKANVRPLLSATLLLKKQKEKQMQALTTAIPAVLN
jgi:hypothetical protein